MSESKPHTGRCTCGSVVYQFDVEPIFVNCCHCTWCQRETGASYVLHAMVESGHCAVLEGKIESNTIPTESGGGQKINRCAECKVVLWSNYGSANNKINYIKVGTLDEPDRLPPGAQIFTRSKQSWITLSDNIPSFEKFYKARELWSEDSLARARAARA